MGTEETDSGVGVVKSEMLETFEMVEISRGFFRGDCGLFRERILIGAPFGWLG